MVYRAIAAHLVRKAGIRQGSGRTGAVAGFMAGSYTVLNMGFELPVRRMEGWPVPQPSKA